MFHRSVWTGWSKFSHQFSLLVLKFCNQCSSSKGYILGAHGLQYLVVFSCTFFCCYLLNNCIDHKSHHKLKCVLLFLRVRDDSNKDKENLCGKVYFWLHKIILIISRFNLVYSSVKWCTLLQLCECRLYLWGVGVLHKEFLLPNFGQNCWAISVRKGL